MSKLVGRKGISSKKFRSVFLRLSLILRNPLRALCASLLRVLLHAIEVFAGTIVGVASALILFLVLAINWLPETFSLLLHFARSLLKFLEHLVKLL